MALAFGLAASSIFPVLMMGIFNKKMNKWGAIWGMAVLGIVLDAAHPGGRRILPMLIYLLMGWMIVVALGPLLAALPADGFRWLLAGGRAEPSGEAASASAVDHRGEGVEQLGAVGADERGVDDLQR